MISSFPSEPPSSRSGATGAGHADLLALARGLARSGLILRGGFHPEPGEGVPAPGDGAVPGTVVMIGNVGPRMWRAFSRWRAARGAGHTLDAWTSEVVSRGAERVGATAVFPFEGPPYLPFQRWAQRAEAVWPSPIGILIHPEFGLWHAYRAALIFAERLSLGSRIAADNPCDRCEDRPCLHSCPVAAFDRAGYHVRRCRDHIATVTGADCVRLGCRARRACPVGPEYRYEPDQAEFHMRAFLADPDR